MLSNSPELSFVAASIIVAVIFGPLILLQKRSRWWALIPWAIFVGSLIYNAYRPLRSSQITSFSVPDLTGQKMNFGLMKKPAWVYSGEKFWLAVTAPNPAPFPGNRPDFELSCEIRLEDTAYQPRESQQRYYDLNMAWMVQSPKSGQPINGRLTCTKYFRQPNAEHGDILFESDFEVSTLRPIYRDVYLYMSGIGACVGLILWVIVLRRRRARL